MAGSVVKRLSSSGLAQGGFAFFVATGAVSVSNFLFHVVVSRLLGPSNYGALGALLNVLLLLAVPLGAIQAAVTRSESALQHSEGHGIGLRSAMMRSVVAGVIGMFVLALLSPVIRGYLHLPSVWSVVLLSIWVLPAIIGAVAQGVLMGRLKFGPVSLAMLLGGVIGRLLLGVLLIELGFGILGAVAASVLSQVIQTAIVCIPLISEFMHSKGYSVGVGLRSGVLSVLALGGYWLLGTEDTVLARHFLSAHSAGLYAASSTAGRIALFLPGAIALIAFPRFSRDKGRGELARNTLRWSLAVVGLLGLGAAAVLALLPSLVVSILFGSGYVGAASTVRILGMEGAGLGVAGLLIYYHLARESLGSLYGWVGAALAFVGVEFFHGSTVSIALVVLLSVAVITVLSFGAAVHALWRDPLIEDLGDVRRRLFEPQEDGDEIDVTLVVPYYNPGKALSNHISELSAVLESKELSYEIIAVSDGSTDGSPDTLDGLLPLVLSNVELPRNYGKGHALRVGLAQGRGKYLGFIDADGDIPAYQVAALVDLIRDTRPDIVTGSKRHPDSDVYYPPIRRVYSWGYQLLIKVLFNLSVTDTQTGLKVIRREVLAQVLPLMVEKRFAFDLELFVVAKRLGFTDVVEAPVVIQRRFTSTVSIKAVRGMMIDTLGILYRLRVLRYYDRVQSELSESSNVACPIGNGSAIAEMPSITRS